MNEEATDQDAKAAARQRVRDIPADWLAEFEAYPSEPNILDFDPKFWKISVDDAGFGYILSAINLGIVQGFTSGVLK